LSLHEVSSIYTDTNTLTHFLEEESYLCKHKTIKSVLKVKLRLSVPKQMPHFNQAYVNVFPQQMTLFGLTQLPLYNNPWFVSNLKN